MITVVAALFEGAPPGGGAPTVMLARRAPGKRHGGLWELPGGKVEEGEEPEAALAREIREELGAEILVLGLHSDYEAEVEGLAFRFIVFRARLQAPPAFLAAHDATSFVSPADLIAYALAPLDAPALDLWKAGTRVTDRGLKG